MTAQEYLTKSGYINPIVGNFRINYGSREQVYEYRVSDVMEAYAELVVSKEKEKLLSCVLERMRTDPTDVVGNIQNLSFLEIIELLK